MGKTISINTLLLNSRSSFDDLPEVIKDVAQGIIIEKTDSYIIYKRNSHKDHPKWLKNFNNNIKKLSTDDFSKNNSEGLLLLMKVTSSTNEERIFAISFGKGSFSLNQKMLEKGFGIYIAYHLSKDKDNKLKSYQSRLVDTNPINKKMVFAEGTISQNGIPYAVDNESIRELSISCAGKTLCARAIGKAKSFEIAFLFEDNEMPCLNHLPCKLKEILDIYLSIPVEEKQELYKGLILVESDKEDELNNILIQSLSTDNNFSLFEPEIDFDWTDVAQIVYENCNRKLTDDNKELSLKKLFDLGGIPSVDYLKNTNITLVGNSGTALKKWSAFKCLYGEMQHNEEVYILSDEEYLQIKKNKYDRITDNISAATQPLAIPSSVTSSIETKIKSYAKGERINREYIFNSHYANHLNAELMDEQSKQIKLYDDQFEVCDIFDKANNCFYHSKIKRNPESISHLFQQGYVSGSEFAKYKEDFEKEMNSKITNTANHIAGTSVGKMIHYIVLSQTCTPRLTFFQKMSLEEKLTSLKAWGFDVKVSLVGNCWWAK